MAKFTKLSADKHYAIQNSGGDLIAWVWGFVAAKDTNWPVGATAFVSDDGEASAVDVAESGTLPKREG